LPAVSLSFRAVIFDLGGVVLDSPLHAIARYEAELGIPAGHVNRVVGATGPAGAWARLERGELSLLAFEPAFERECAEAGHALSAREMMLRIAASSAPRPAMLRAIQALRRRGLAVAALTNNWESEGSTGGTLAELRAEFDAFVESSVVGLRKPDPRIYLHACEALRVRPAEAVFLDDIGRNLKAARELGMATIKVEEPAAALAELAQVLGLEAAALA
jgi:putative hydrolase of the HAD superfamily